MIYLLQACNGIWSIFNQDIVRILLFLLPVVVVVISFLYIQYRLQKRILPVVYYAVLCAFVAPIFLFIQALIFYILGIFFEEIPPSANFHPLNASVKIACLGDKSREYCPRTLNELYARMPSEWDVRKNIESRRYRVTYRYYSESNDYTIIVRPVRSTFTDTLVAVFDSRFQRVGFSPFDFSDLRISKCFGNYSITNPPKIEGPWENITNTLCMERDSSPRRGIILKVF